MYLNTLKMPNVTPSLYKMWKDHDILLITNLLLAILSRAKVMHICIFCAVKSTTKMTYSFCFKLGLYLWQHLIRKTQNDTQRDMNVGWILHVRTCVCRMMVVGSRTSEFLVSWNNNLVSNMSSDKYRT